MTNADRIIAELRQKPCLDDDELAKRIGILRQTVNQECRHLEQKRILVRERGGSRGKIINRLRVADVKAGSVRQGASISQNDNPDAQEPVRRICPTGAESINIGGCDFVRICEIIPQCDSGGRIEPLSPQSRYSNSGRIGLHKYGHGPFCKFSIPSDRRQAGVYLIVVETVVKYVGECENLSSRYNAGYGNISPRNCFVRGQETNCRVNNLIYHSASEMQKTVLWFHETEAYKLIERELRDLLTPEWNRI